MCLGWGVEREKEAVFYSLEQRLCHGEHPRTGWERRPFWICLCLSGYFLNVGQIQPFHHFCTLFPAFLVEPNRSHYTSGLCWEVFHWLFGCWYWLFRLGVWFLSMQTPFSAEIFLGVWPFEAGNCHQDAFSLSCGWKAQAFLQVKGLQSPLCRPADQGA